MALSKIDTTNMIEDVPQSKLDNNINFRNIIINGDMSIAQRGTSATTLALSSGGFRYNDVDRFAVNAGNVSSGQVSTEQINSGLDGFPKAKRITVTTAEVSPATNGYLSIVHNIEGQNLQYIKYGTSNALALTLSFYIRSSVTGNFAGNIIQTDSRPSQNRAFIFNYTINSANTWEKKTISILADASGVIDNDNNNSFEINLTYLYLGSDYSNGTLNTWNSNPSGNSYSNNATRVNLLATSGATFDITGVQLEAGTTASDFEFLPRDISLQRCYRYCYKTPTGSLSHIYGEYCNAHHYTTTTMLGLCSVNPVEMRAPFTVTFSGSFESYGASAVHSISSLSSNEITSRGFQINGTSSVARTVGQGVTIRNSNNTTAFILQEAEI